MLYKNCCVEDVIRGVVYVAVVGYKNFVLDPELKRPAYVVQNVLEAVKLVFEKERMQ
jgi:hypothetical protein